MYLMYVDESGDPGITGSPTRFFVLSGLVVHESNWNVSLDALIAFRRRMNGAFGIKLREEIHASHFINNPGSLSRIRRNDRLTILRHFANEIARLPQVSVINVVVDKSTKTATYDVHSRAWEALVQRFENTIRFKNFPTPALATDQGLIFPDGQPAAKLDLLLRRMRRFNPIPSQLGGHRMLPLTRIIEDPNYRDSAKSYFVQAADLCAYLLYQHYAPNSYMRRSGGMSYFRRISPVYCRAAATANPLGIVIL